MITIEFSFEIRSYYAASPGKLKIHNLPVSDSQALGL